MTPLPSSQEQANIAEVAVLTSICQHGAAEPRLYKAQPPVSQGRIFGARLDFLFLSNANKNQNIGICLWIPASSRLPSFT